MGHRPRGFAEGLVGRADESHRTHSQCCIVSHTKHRKARSWSIPTQNPSYKVLARCEDAGHLHGSVQEQRQSGQTCLWQILLSSLGILSMSIKFIPMPDVASFTSYLLRVGKMTLWIKALAPRGGRRQAVPASCPLTSMCTPLLARVHTK